MTPQRHCKKQKPSDFKKNYFDNPENMSKFIVINHLSFIYYLTEHKTGIKQDKI